MLVRKFINLFVLVLMSFLFLFNCGNNDSKLIIPAESLDINDSNNDFVLVGDTVHYTSSVMPSTISASKIQWSSLNEKVATVSETGVLTALRRGETILKASIDDVESTITIRVRNIPQGYIRLHFNTGFNNENLGLGFWSNDAIEANRLYYIIDDESYSYANPYPIDNSQSDTFGVYVDIPVIDEYGSIWVDLLIHYDTSNEYKGLCEVDIKDIDKYNEFWIDVNNSKVYYDEPNINYPISSLIIRNEYFDLSPGDTIQLNHQKNSQETNINFVSKEWLSSNNEVAEINDSGLLTVKGYGNVKIILRANGFETEKELIFVKPPEINIIRVHYLRYDNNYENINIRINGIKKNWTGLGNFSTYIDITNIAHGNVINYSINKGNDILQSGTINITDKNTYWITQGKSNVTDNFPAIDKGAFKIANSWGVGVYDWEYVEDGYFYMTYDLFKKLPGGVFFVKPDFNHSPKAIAVFNITHPLRNEVRIRLGVGNPSNPEKERYFRANLNLYLMEQWNNEEYDRVPMPDSNIVIDITEFLPLNNDTIYIEIYDKDDSSATGTINYFAIELYDDYSQAPTDSYVAAMMPVETVDGETIAVSIGNIQSQQILASIKRTSSDNNGWLELETRPAELEDISDLNLLENNSLDFSTGLRKLSDKGLKNIIDEGNLRVVNKAVFHSFSGQTADTAYDNSTSKFFPPIGNQKQKGSCVSWAVGYYIMSYYTAWKNDWDLSMIEWNGGDIAEEHQHKIMSPDFLFNLINGGLNIGSYVYDSFNIVNEIGISSLKTMPIIDDDFTSWPTEEAWREAANNRITEDKNVYYVPIKNNDDIEIVKSLLRQGYLMRMAWNGYNPRYFSNNDGLTTTNNIITGSNHASTIVGYDDDWTAEF